MPMQTHALLENLIIALYLFLVRVNILRSVSANTVVLSCRHVALTVAAPAEEVLLRRRHLLKLFMRVVVHILLLCLTYKV